MSRQSRNATSRRRFSTSLLLLLAAVVLPVTAASFSSSLPQGAGKVSMNDIHFVLITAADVRNLPAGENRLVQKESDPSTAQGTTYVTPGTVRNTATTQPTGSVTFFIDGVARNTSTPLTKTGAGQLILPSANSYGGSDLTKVGRGELQNAGNSSAGLTKSGPGTLVLTSAGGVVYEFRNLGLAEAARVFVPAGNTNTELKAFVQQQRPADAGGWPKRLIIGQAKDIASVEGWKTGKEPKAGSSCQGRFCQCNGSAGCLSLANSGACSSGMTCDGTGNSVRCYCSAK